MTVVEIDLEQNTQFEMYLYFSVSCHSSSCSQQPKITKLAVRKKMWPTRVKILDLRNTNEKNVCTYKIPTRKTFVPTKHPREKKLDSQNTHKKVLDPRSTHEKKFRTPKYSRSHNGTIELDPRWHGTLKI